MQEDKGMQVNFPTQMLFGHNFNHSTDLKSYILTQNLECAKDKPYALPSLQTFSLISLSQKCGEQVVANISKGLFLREEKQIP